MRFEEFETGDFICRLATDNELDDVYHLRYKYLIQEYNKDYVNETETFIVDEDKYAYQLIVLEKTTKKIVGTYRMIANSGFVDTNLCVQKEFDIASFIKNKSYLEIGGLCVAMDYRNGPVIFMLVKGVYRFARDNSLDYIFGLTSFLYKDIVEYDDVFKYIYDNYQLDVEILAKVPSIDLSKCKGVSPYEKIKTTMPPVLRLYLLLGGKINRYAAIDYSYPSIDLFTVLNTAEMNLKMIERLLK